MEQELETPFEVYFREWRDAAGFTQEQLGKLVGMSKTHISRIETRKRLFTSIFLLDFYYATKHVCPHWAEPLLRGPSKSERREPVSDDELERFFFDRHSAQYKSLRQQSELKNS